MKKPAAIITLIYLVSGILWIYCSDKLLYMLYPSKYYLLEMYKGVLFICITSILLFYLLRYFYLEQKKQLLQLQASHIELIRTEENYRLLFEDGPMPKWIFDPETLKFLDVNELAVEHYGYSREQFLNMTIRDIRPREDMDDFLSLLQRINGGACSSYKGTVRHMKANSEILYVDIYSCVINYNGKSAKAVTACDVTDRIKYIEEIELQNKRLRDISWVQSHIVRSPLASLMGLMNLLKSEQVTKEEEVTVKERIITCANKLDDAIRKIIAKANPDSNN